MVCLQVVDQWPNMTSLYVIGRTTGGGTGFDFSRPWLTWMLGLSLHATAASDYGRHIRLNRTSRPYLRSAGRAGVFEDGPAR